MENKIPRRVTPIIPDLPKTDDTPPNEISELFLKSSSFAHQILDNTNPLWEYFLIDSQNLKKKADIINYITEFLTTNFIFKAIIDRKKNADLYIFNNETHYYDFISLAQFCGEIDELFQGFPVLMGKYITKNGIDIYDRICNRNIMKDEDLDYYPDFLPFTNGIYDFNTYEFFVNTPDNFITKTLPYDRDPEVDCPLFKKTMAEILPNEHDRNIVLTYLSYCLSGSIKLELAQIWMGKKNNGKTKLSEFMAILMGDLGCSIPFEDFALEPGAICRTRGKRYNTAGEMGGDYLNKSAVNRAKKLITDKLMSGRDAYERFQKWFNQCKHTYPTNDLPNPRKCKKAFFRRWQIIFFTVDFTGREDRTIFDRIYEQEAAGVISYLLTFVPRWEELLVTDADAVEEIWKNDALSTYQFIQEMCEIDRSYKIESQELYGVYGDWCLEQGKTPISMKIFGSDLRQEGIYWSRLRDENMEKGDNRVNYYVGIQLKDSTVKKISQNKLTDQYEGVKKDIESPKPIEDIIEFSLEEKKEKKKSEPTPEMELTHTTKILDQLKALHDEYGKEVYFSEDDIFEPLYTWMDREDYKKRIMDLMKSGKIEGMDDVVRLKK